MSRKIILYGAFDRYNFGDNLMPIIWRELLREKIGESPSCKIIVASIFSRNLSRWKCLDTVSIKKAVKGVSETSIIVVGGEVLGANTLCLLSHHYGKAKLLNKVDVKTNYFVSKVCSFVGGLGWIFPFIVDPHFFCNSRVFYCALGGSADCADVQIKKQKIKHLVESSYLSFRDYRMERSGLFGKSVNTFPDVVHLIPKFFNVDWIRNFVRVEFLRFENSHYHVFQCSPWKCGADKNAIIEEIMHCKKVSRGEIILLPIGYAKGHDDGSFLKQVAASTDLICHGDLNVWEIYWILMNCSSYFGTSLHGTIVAMTHSIPHYNFGEVEKCYEYLAAWSVAPFTKKHSIEDFSRVIQAVEDNGNDFENLLEKVSRRVQQMAEENVDQIISRLGS